MKSEYPMNRWQMVSHNGGILNPKTIELSTVEMPRLTGLDLGYSYESCVFSTTDCDVVERYDTLSEAIQGHARWCNKLGLEP